MSVLIGVILIGIQDGEWLMYGREPTHQRFSPMVAEMDTQPPVKWYYETGSWQYGWEGMGLAIGDANNDGETDVVGIKERANAGVYCLKGSDGSLEWRYLVPVDSCQVSSAPVIYDVDGDGKNEVLAAIDYLPKYATDTSKLLCLDENGNLQWSWQSTGTSIHRSPTAADVDGDGNIEVLFYHAGTGILYCFNGSDGSIKWQKSVSGSYEGPAVADVDGDGQMEVVISNYSSVVCLSGSNGAEEWDTRDSIGSIYGISAAPTIADLDHDGQKEVLIATDRKNAYCFRGSTGGLIWQTQMDTSSGYEYMQAPVVGDADGDGLDEVVIFGYRNYRVYGLDTDGTLLWVSSAPGYCHMSGAMADLDNGGNLEVIMSTSSAVLRCLNAEDGSVLWNKDLDSDGGGDMHHPVIGDVDDDGTLEIALSCARRVIVLDDPSPLYDKVDEKDGKAGLEFRTAGQNIYLFAPTATQISLNLYDASGRLVQTLFNGVLAPGAHTFSPSTGVSGVYMAVLNWSGGTRTVKVVK